MDRSAHDLIAMASGKFLGEHHIPLVGLKVLVSSIGPVLVIATRTNLLWPYILRRVYLSLCGDSLKVAKSRPEPESDTPPIPPAELRLTTRDLFSGVEALKRAGRSSFVK